MHNLVCIIGVYKPVEICKLGSFQAELTPREEKREEAAELSKNKLFCSLQYNGERERGSGREREGECIMRVHPLKLDYKTQSPKCH